VAASGVSSAENADAIDSGVLPKDMDYSYFEQRLEDYRRALCGRAAQAVIDDAWSKLLAVAVDLRGPTPSGVSPELAAAYAVGNARGAKDAAWDFESIEPTIDTWLEALERFHQVVTGPG
jgi:hypothetical protein